MKAIHGGASFDAIGNQFDDLNRRKNIITADVLDAWYDPSPNVVAAIQPHLEWLIKSSPPAHGEGLRRVIAEERGLNEGHVFVGAGSSSLMFLALPHLLKSAKRVLILDPMYGEYAHLVEQFSNAELVRVDLKVEDDFNLDTERLSACLRDVDGVILVNPNSPTGRAAPRAELKKVLAYLPDNAWIWIDETYVDFADGEFSFEPFVASDPRIIVCKSMSKFYGLSGLRIGYVATSNSVGEILEMQTPPWAVGLIGQVAAIEALRDHAYYDQRRTETVALRGHLTRELKALELQVVPSEANFLLFRLPNHNARQFCQLTAGRGVFLRNCDSLSPRFSGDFVRTAVKDESSNATIITAIAAALEKG
jgi:histidinol-phosphate/aromatic aminotransferase/cobyric acid decarboxylase-like protein